MTWVRIDDKAPHHPKMIRAGAEACWLWQASLCYSNAHRLNGRIEKDLVPMLYPPLAAKAKALAAKLVEVRLWHDCGDHFEIHDYQEFQEQALKANVDDRKEYERERKRRQRQRGQIPDNVPDVSRTNVPDGLGHVPSVTRADPVPSRPVPSLSPDPQGENSGTSASPPERSPTTTSHEQECLDAFAESYERAGAGSAPRLIGEVRKAAVEHCRDVARIHGKTLREAALAVGAAALPGSKRWHFDVATVDPFAAPAKRQAAPVIVPPEKRINAREGV